MIRYGKSSTLRLSRLLLSRFMRDKCASMSIEAAIILPAMLAFVLLMVSLIQIATVELALRSAVAETGKGVAGYWPPIRMVYQEAKEKVAATQAGTWVTEALAKVEGAKSQWTAQEEWLLQYEAILPDMAVELLKWEIERRNSLEEGLKEEWNTLVDKVTQPLLCRAFEPILRHYANSDILDFDRLSVEAVRLPGLEKGGSSNVEITASYRLRLFIPLWSKTITLEKKSIERAWVGEE